MSHVFLLIFNFKYHEIFSQISDSDILYENLCKSTRVVFGLIHDIHFADTGSNIAYLKFYELLDAWGGLAEYLKIYDVFPQPFINWFESIFKIYESRDYAGTSVLSIDELVKLYISTGMTKDDAMNAYLKVTFVREIYWDFKTNVNIIFIIF